MVDARRSGANRRVLVVAGDPSFAGALVPEFEAFGFAVDTVSTAEAATARVVAAPPDLVLLDLYLSHGAALDLLRAWKSRHPELKVVLTSQSASLNAVVGALKEGASCFFARPVSVAAILQEVYESSPQSPYLSPRVDTSHLLGSEALKAEGVDRFFAVSSGLLSVAGFDGYFKMLNPAWEKVLGYSIDELCATPYLDLVHPDDRDKASDEALELRGGQTVFHFRNRYRCKDSSYRWLSWIATPSPAHELIYASARDVTNIVRMEQGLRESNKRLKGQVASRDRKLRESSAKNDTLVELARFKDEVASMIVHDLKNPLSVVVANYDYLLDGFEGSADCLEALQDSRNAGQRMLRLLANLIDVSRLESGTLDVHSSEMTLSQLLEPIAEQRRVLARSRKIAIVLAPAAEMTVVVDPDLLIRTVENIFDNAIRHTPVGGRIEVERRQVGPDVEVRIGNSGGAIPLEARRTIFDKTRQGPAGVGRMNLGLGLYFCRLAIEAQGGQLWVEETDRMPTVFGIRLPRASPHGDNPAARQT
ncbi:MAG: sensory box histidine kinase [Myxococcales bacterium]|nr:sensory box histidine kinase [Myxococcales bacterium]